jgi:uncharacterized protein (TIGR00251 family)
MTTSDLPFLSASKDGLIISVYVQPRASRNQLCGVQGVELKIRLTSPPVDGAANKLCREYIAELFAVSKSNVEIISGETSRHKRLRIVGSGPEQFSTQITALKAALNAGAHK